MNNQQRAAMQMALEALEHFKGKGYNYDKVITALREALAQPQDPSTIILPVDVTIAGRGTIKAGCTLQTLLTKIAMFNEWWDKQKPQVVCSKMETTTTQGEPVAWIHHYKTGAEQINTAPPETYVGWSHTPLYTNPPSVEAAKDNSNGTRNTNGITELNNSNCSPDYWLGYGLQAHTEKPFEEATPVYLMPPSIEAAIEVTKEKAAKLCDELQIPFQFDGIELDWVQGTLDCAAAIRSMK